jgi:hypothetical protein
MTWLVEGWMRFVAGWRNGTKRTMTAKEKKIV